MKILVTGKNGQVGYELERSLQGLGQITALNRDEMDLANFDNIRAVIRAFRPDLIVNAAAYTAVDKAESESESAMKINGEAPGIIAEEAKKINAALIHYSTDYVFDGSKVGEYVETDLTNPINVYGRSKLAGELAIAAVGVPHLILRTSWVYGMRGKNFLLTISRLAREKRKLNIVSDQIGAPTWCRTIADSTAHIIAKSSDADDLKHRFQEWSGIYHLTAQGAASWYEFACGIVNSLDLEQSPDIAPIHAVEYPVPAQRPMNSRMSCARFMNTFCSLPNWDASLKLCMET